MESKDEFKEEGKEEKEGKKEGKESGVEPLAMVDVQRIDIESGPQPLTSSLDLEIDFALDRPLSNAFWQIKYMVDTVRQRHFIELGQTDTIDYSEGASHFSFSVSPCHVLEIRVIFGCIRRRRKLTSAALSQATLQMPGCSSPRS